MAPTRSKLFHFRRGEFPLVGAILLILSLVSFNSPKFAKCQWYKLSNFGQHISTIYFLNDQSAPLTGFVGLGYFSTGVLPIGSKVWKTTDGGISWTLCNSSKFTLTGITNFSFKDSNIGWVSGGHLGVYPGYASCLRTTDCGNTWTPVLEGIENVEASSVYFHNPTNLLFVTAWAGGTKVSSDLGTTWSTISNKTNGVAFVNDNDGIMTRVSDGGVVFYPTLRTIDGGLTWLQTNLLEETWQPLAIKGTQIFFCVGDLSNNIYRSNDGGVTWSIISNIQSNGHIAGTLDKLFIQNTTPGLGILVSTDQGIRWKSLCGPVAQWGDTRFYVNNNVVYASDFYIEPYNVPEDYGRLWVNTTGNGSGERLLLSHTSGNREFTLTAGYIWKTDIALPDTFSTIQRLKLDSLAFTVRYEADVLSLKSAEAASGWKLISATESLGKVSVKLLRESSNDRGVPVVSLSFQANIAREKETDVYIDSVYYNAGEFTNCEVLASEKLHVAISDECGDSTLREFLNSKPILEIVSLFPNPTSGDVTVEFNSLLQGELTLQVLNDIGYISYEEKLVATQGMNSHTIPIPKNWSGTFYLRLQMGKTTVTGKFVKQ